MTQNINVVRRASTPLGALDHLWLPRDEAFFDSRKAQQEDAGDMMPMATIRQFVLHTRCTLYQSPVDTKHLDGR